MYFAVEFVGETPDGSRSKMAYKTKDKRVGLDFIDAVREELEITNLSIKVFNNTARGDYGWGRVVFFDEARARRIAERYGHFRDSSYLVVKIPELWLNKYFKITYRVSKNSDTGAIEGIFPHWTLDEEMLLSDWEAAGCPTAWFPPEEKEEETS